MERAFCTGVFWLWILFWRLYFLYRTLWLLCPLERVNSMADYSSCLTLGTQKSKGNTASVQMCDTRERGFVTRWWKSIFWTKMWEANPTVAERNQANVAQNRLPFISDLPKKDKYKLKERNTTCFLPTQTLSCWPCLSFKRGSNWVSSFEVNQMMGLLKLISTFLHAGTSMKRELGTQPSEVETAGNLSGCGITEVYVDPLCQLQQWEWAKFRNNISRCWMCRSHLHLQHSPSSSSELPVHPESLESPWSRDSFLTEPGIKCVRWSEKNPHHEQ